MPAPNCLSLFDHFVGLALKGLTYAIIESNFSKASHIKKNNG